MQCVLGVVLMKKETHFPTAYSVFHNYTHNIENDPDDLELGPALSSFLHLGTHMFSRVVSGVTDLDCSASLLNSSRGGVTKESVTPPLISIKFEPQNVWIFWFMIYSEL